MDIIDSSFSTSLTYCIRKIFSATFVKMRRFVTLPKCVLLVTAAVIAGRLALAEMIAVDVRENPSLFFKNLLGNYDKLRRPARVYIHDFTQY